MFRKKKKDSSATAGGSTPDKPGRIAQIRQAYTMARRTDTRLGWYLAGIFLGIAAVVVALALLVGPWYIWLLIGLPAALLATSIFFGRRAEAAAYAQMAGQPGAAASAMQLLRRGWSTEAAIAVTRQQDLVHRAVGRPGIVLVGEGNPNRVQHLLSAERKRHQRVTIDTTVTTLVVGDGEGQVPLDKLAKTIRKLPKTQRPADVTEVVNRLRAMPTRPVPIPKGPLPKGARMPKGGLPPR